MSSASERARRDSSDGRNDTNHNKAQQQDNMSSNRVTQNGYRSKNLTTSNGQPNKTTEFAGDSHASNSINGNIASKSVDDQLDDVALAKKLIALNGVAQKSGPTAKNSASKKAQKRDDINNNNHNSDDQNKDSFADTQTMGIHAKLNSEDPVVFSQANSSIGQSARDQFAVALLRLQSELESTSKRLGEIEGKVETIGKRQQQQQQQSKARGDEQKRSSKGILAKENLASNLFYFSWPIVVFFALRALERRSVAASKSI